MASKAIEVATNYFRNAKNYERSFQKLKVLTIGGGNCTAELKVEEQHTNAIGSLHGGCSSTLVDTVSTIGLFTHERVQGIPTVSVDLHITFMKSAKIGEDLLIDSKTVKVGKSLAFCDVNILNKETNEILVKGSHTKFILNPKEQS